MLCCGLSFWARGAKPWTSWAHTWAVVSGSLIPTSLCIINMHLLHAQHWSKPWSGNTEDRLFLISYYVLSTVTNTVMWTHCLGWHSCASQVGRGASGWGGLSREAEPVSWQVSAPDAGLSHPKAHHLSTFPCYFFKNLSSMHLRIAGGLRARGVD